MSEFKYYIGVEVHKIYLSAILDFDRRSIKSRIMILVMDTFDYNAHPLFFGPGIPITSQAFYNRLKKHHMKKVCPELHTVLTMDQWKDFGNFKTGNVL